MHLSFANECDVLNIYNGMDVLIKYEAVDAESQTENHIFNTEIKYESKFNDWVFKLRKAGYLYPTNKKI